MFPFIIRTAFICLIFAVFFPRLVRARNSRKDRPRLGTVYSNEALNNPYHPRVTLISNFINIPLLTGTIFDSHFVSRDRMGRLVCFLARIIQNGWTAKARGIGIDERTALVVEADSSAFLHGAGAAYFLHTPGIQETCKANTPLTYRNIGVFKLSAAGIFNLNSWTGTGGVDYTISAESGSIVSSKGSVY